MNNDMKKNLIEDIKSYYEHYVYMADVMRVCDHIGEYEMFENEKLEIAPNFFRIVRAATIDSYMLTFARLYDNSEETKSIQNLIRKCKKNISLFFDKENVSKKLIEFECRMEDDEEISSAIKTIKHRRDKMFVHNDKKFFNHPEKDTSYLPIQQLGILRVFTKEVLIYLLGELDETPIRETTYDNDLDKLFINSKENLSK